MTTLRDKLARAMFDASRSGLEWGAEAITHAWHSERPYWERDADACLRVLAAEPVSEEAAWTYVAAYDARASRLDGSYSDWVRSGCAAFWRAMLGAAP